MIKKTHAILMGVYMILMFSFLGSANALSFIQTYWDLNTALSGHTFTNDGKTEEATQFQYYAETSSFVYDLDGNGRDVGDGIIDYGDMHATSITAPVPLDLEGMNIASGYEITMSWRDLTGYITSIDAGGVHTTYTSGTFNLYADAPDDDGAGGTQWGYFGPSGVNTGTIDNNLATFTDGTLVATIQLTSGGNTVNAVGGGTGSSYQIFGDFTYLLDGFWIGDLDSNGVAETDLQDLIGSSTAIVFGYTHGDNDPLSLQFVNATDTSNAPYHDWSLTQTNTLMYRIDTNHDSSLSVGVAPIPEPATFMLFGVGLMGLASFGRKKLLKK